MLEQLKEYDDNLSVGQLKKKIIADQEATRKEENTTYERVKNDFSNTYLKRVNQESLFGKQLEVYHIDTITDKTRTEDWNFVFFVKGSRVSFSARDLNFTHIKGDRTYETFSEDSLNKMEKITQEEYQYYLNKYTEITSNLKTLIR
jgi:hypothetical protein